MKKILTLGFILINILFLAACSNNELVGNEDPIETTSNKQISIPIYKIRTLNPIISKDEETFYINNLIYDSLIDLDKNLVPIPELAESWVYEENGKRLVISLRTNVKWHDGKSLSPEDVKFTIDTLIKAQWSGETLYSKNVSNISSVSTNDINQVIINFRTNSNNTVEMLNFPIIPKHKFANYKRVLEFSSEFIPIGTGAYLYEKSPISNSILLSPNLNYYKEEKALNSLLFKIIPDKESAVTLFEIGDLMITFSQAIDRETIFGDKDVNIFPYTSNEVEFIGFNFRNKYINDANIRIGIANSIDAQKIIDEAYYGNGIRNDNIYFPNYLGKNTSDGLISNNLNKSLELFNQSGFINRDNDVYIENAAGDEITIKILVNAENKSRVTAAQIIKNNLDKLPIHSDIIIKDWNEYQYAINSGNYDIYLGGLKISEQYDLSFALHSNINPLGYSNEILDEYLEKMQTGLTKEAKFSTFISIKEILNRELPYYCILYKTHAAISSKNFQGTVNPYFFSIYNQCFDWTYIN